VVSGVVRVDGVDVGGGGGWKFWEIEYDDVVGCVHGGESGGGDGERYVGMVARFDPSSVVHESEGERKQAKVEPLPEGMLVRVGAREFLEGYLAQAKAGSG
jgi:hypothetical protein